MILAKLRTFPLFFVISIVLSAFFILSSPLQSASPPPPSRAEVCTVVKSMPNSNNTDEMLSLLETSRSQVVQDLIAVKSDMELYDAEKYGWPSMINSSDALKPNHSAWLIGALRIACES